VNKLNFNVREDFESVHSFRIRLCSTASCITSPFLQHYACFILFSRQIALKALSERLSKVDPQPTMPVSWEQDQKKLPAPPSTSQAVAITMPSEDTPAKSAVTSPAPSNKMITVEDELAKT